MTEQDITIHESEVPSTGTRLYCRTARPSSTPWARLLIVHGYGEHSTRYSQFMRWLAVRGIASTTFDQRGHGHSPGRRGYVHRWEEYLDDLQAMLNRPAEDADGPQYVMGHSHGSLITAAAGERGMLAAAGVAGCILASPYLATRLHIPAWKLILARASHYLLPAMKVPNGLRSEHITSDPQMAAEDQCDPLMNHCATPRWYFTMRQTQSQVMRDAAKWTLPLLCLIGEADMVADPAIAEEFYRRATSADKSLYLYPGRRHELYRDLHREKVFADVFRWIRSRTLGARAMASKLAQ